MFKRNKWVSRERPGSARVTRAGFGVAPKQSFEKFVSSHALRTPKVRDRETRSLACETQALPRIEFEP